MSTATLHPIRIAANLVGGMSTLAERAGVSRWTLYKAVSAGPTVSPKLAAAIDDATDGRVSREILCPEIYATPPRPSRRHADRTAA